MPFAFPAFCHPSSRPATAEVFQAGESGTSGAQAHGPTRQRPSTSRRTSTPRSEEHTSELQSLKRTSNAVLCLKKKQLNTLHSIVNQHLYNIKHIHNTDTS